MKNYPPGPPVGSSENEAAVERLRAEVVSSWLTDGLTAIVYRDVDGSPISLNRLVRNEPEWAESMIRQYRNRLHILCKLLVCSDFQTAVDLARKTLGKGDGHD